MPFVSTPNVMMVEIRYDLAGQKIENRIMVDNLASIATSDLTAVAAQVWVQWSVGGVQHLSDTLSLREVVATDLTVQNGEQVTYATGGPIAGGQPGRCLPNESAFCISLRSTARGRSARGRMFLPAIPVALMDDSNNIGATSAAILAADVNALLAVIRTGGRDPVIVSYRANKAPRVGGPVYFSIATALFTDTLIDSMRRRKPGVGQ